MFLSMNNVFVGKGCLTARYSGKKCTLVLYIYIFFRWLKYVLLLPRPQQCIAELPCRLLLQTWGVPSTSTARTAAITLRSLTLAVQHGLGLEVELRCVWFGRGRAQGVGRERERIGGRLAAGLADGLCAAHHLLSLRLRDGLGGRMGQLLGHGVGQLLGHRLGRLLRSRLRYGLGHGSCALQKRNESRDVEINRNCEAENP